MPEPERAPTAFPQSPLPQSSASAAALPAHSEGSLAAPASARSGRARRAAMARHIRYAPNLRPWMLAYAEALVTAPEPLSIAERRALANQLAKVRISTESLNCLERRPDFCDYIDELQRGPIEAARAKYLSRLPKYIDGLDRVFDEALSEGDAKTVVQIAEGALDRVVPKKQERPVTAISITLQPRQEALLTDDSAVEVLAADVLDVESDAAGG